MEVFDDGTGPALYVGGDFDHLARWDGETWTELPLREETWGHFGVVKAMEVFDDGSGPALYIGGKFKEINGMTVNNIAKWDGALWSALEGPEPGGAGVDSWVHTMATFDDGIDRFLAVGGEFIRAGGKRVWRVARWDGERWLGLSGPKGSGCDAPLYSLAVVDFGNGAELLAGGWFVRAGGMRTFGVARWNGRRWNPVGTEERPGILGTARDLLAIEGGPLDGLYAIGGAFEPGPNEGPSEDPWEVFGFLRWDGSEWTPLSDQPGGWYTGFDGILYRDGDGPSLYFIGDRMQDEDGSYYRLGRWNGMEWTPIRLRNTADHPGGVFNALCVFDDGSGPALYIGGNFTLILPDRPRGIVRLTCGPGKAMEAPE